MGWGGVGWRGWGCGMGGAALRKRGTEATDLPGAAAETGSTGELLCYVGQSVPSFFFGPSLSRVSVI